MTQAPAIEATQVSVAAEQRSYPPYDAFHGTPSPMLWRRVRIETPRGSAAFEQTDYGHPGKLNPWQPRGIDSSLQPRLQQLHAVVEAVAALL